MSCMQTLESTTGLQNGMTTTTLDMTGLTLASSISTLGDLMLSLGLSSTTRGRKTLNSLARLVCNRLTQVKCFEPATEVPLAAHSPPLHFSCWPPLRSSFAGLSGATMPVFRGALTLWRINFFNPEKCLSQQLQSNNYYPFQVQQPKGEGGTSWGAGREPGGPGQARPHTWQGFPSPTHDSEL